MVVAREKIKNGGALMRTRDQLVFKAKMSCFMKEEVIGYVWEIGSDSCFKKLKKIRWK